MNFDKETKLFIVEATVRPPVDTNPTPVLIPIGPKQEMLRIRAIEGEVPLWIRDITRLHNLKERYETHHPQEIEMLDAINWMIDYYRNPN